jgi:2-oxoglutarate ferredoxin oxidoreductase subunit beta
MGAGATFVARTTAYHALEAQDFIKQAFEHKGFSVVEVVSACPVIYGRLNKKGDAPAMMEDMKKRAFPIQAFDKLSPEDKKDKYKRGIFRKEEKPEYTAQYAKLKQSLIKQEGVADDSE